MLLGIITATLMIGAGFAGLRLVGVSRGPSALGLAPAAGIGLLAVLTTWALRLQVPEEQRPDPDKKLVPWEPNAEGHVEVKRYADEAGFSSCEVLPIEHDFWRFYLLRP